MKRIFLIVISFAFTMGLWAAGAGETAKPTHEHHFNHTELAYEVESMIQIEPSDEIVAIFKDSENDVDNLFEATEKFLYKDANRKEIPRDVKDYIGQILEDDVDDVRDLINDELLKALKTNNVEKTYMIIGTHMFSVEEDYLQ